MGNRSWLLTRYCVSLLGMFSSSLSLRGEAEAIQYIPSPLTGEGQGEGAAGQKAFALLERRRYFMVRMALVGWLLSRCSATLQGCAPTHEAKASHYEIAVLRMRSACNDRGGARVGRIRLSDSLGGGRERRVSTKHEILNAKQYPSPNG
jgi:hypothetical protein